jgi:hypothetical protein
MQTWQNFKVMVDALNLARTKEQETLAAMKDKPLEPGAKWWATVHREQVEALTIAMMPAYSPTHKYTGKQGWEDPSVPHPLKGETCMLMDTYGMSRAGYNATTIQPTRACAAAYCKDGPYGDMDVEQIIAFWQEQEWIVGDYVMLEVNTEDEIVAI